jgi:hypothetical protein
MWWGIGVGAFVLYVVLLVDLGIRDVPERPPVALLARDLLPAALAHRRDHATASAHGMSHEPPACSGVAVLVLGLRSGPDAGHPGEDRRARTID